VEFTTILSVHIILVNANSRQHWSSNGVYNYAISTWHTCKRQFAAEVIVKWSLQLFYLYISYL